MSSFRCVIVNLVVSRHFWCFIDAVTLHFTNKSVAYRSVRQLVGSWVVYYLLGHVLDCSVVSFSLWPNISSTSSCTLGKKSHSASYSFWLFHWYSSWNDTYYSIRGLAKEKYSIPCLKMRCSIAFPIFISLLPTPLLSHYHFSHSFFSLFIHVLSYFYSLFQTRFVAF